MHRGCWSRKKSAQSLKKMLRTVTRTSEPIFWPPRKTIVWPPAPAALFTLVHLFIAMRTFVASTVAALATLRADAFTAPAGVPRSALQVTAHHSFCSAASASSVAASSAARPWARHVKRPRAGGSTGKGAAASLSMFDATDLFQLQQWAGDISATEVENTAVCCVRRLL